MGRASIINYVIASTRPAERPPFRLLDRMNSFGLLNTQKPPRRNRLHSSNVFGG